jgi:hypothetical protein
VNGETHVREASFGGRLRRRHLHLVDEDVGAATELDQVLRGGIAEKTTDRPL